MLQFMRKSRISLLFLTRIIIAQARIGIHIYHVAAVGVIFIIPWVKIAAVKIPGDKGRISWGIKIIFNVQQ